MGGRKYDMLFFDAIYESGGLFVSKNKKWIHPTRIIDSHEIIYVIKGTVYMFEDEIKYKLNKGDCIILEKGKLHGGYEYNTEKEEVSFYWFHFQTRYKRLSDMKHVSFNASSSISVLSKQLLHSSMNPAYVESATECFLRLVLNEIYIAPRRSGSNACPICGVVSDWIMRNSDRKLSVEEISEVFGYNKDYISRAFRTHFGVSLKSYIDAERMRYIKSLLLTTSYPLKQVSELSGFPDYKSFLKFFAYHDPATPQEYRNKFFSTPVDQ